MLDVNARELLALSLPVAAGLALLYALLRWFAWTPRGTSPVWSARVHGFMTAVIALVASGAMLAKVDGRLAAPAGDGSETSDGLVLDADLARVTDVTDLAPPAAGDWLTGVLLHAAGPAALFVLVWWVGQHTWPRTAGAVRRGRLTTAGPADVLPRALTRVVMILTALALTAVAWLALSGIPTVPARLVEMSLDTARITGTDGQPMSSEMQTQVDALDGTLSGPTMAAGHLLALLVTGTSLALAVRAVLRRPVLAGLHPVADLAVRRVAVNRILRVGLLSLVSILVSAVSGLGQGIDANRRLTADPTGQAWPQVANSGLLDSSGGLQLINAVGMLSLAAALTAALWRSPSLALLAQAPGTQHGEAPWMPPATPADGTAAAVRALRDRAGMTAAGLMILGAPLMPILPAGPVTSALASSTPVGPALVAAGPFLLGAVPLVVAEVLVRHRHTAPRGTGDAATPTPTDGGRSVLGASPWRLGLLALAACAVVGMGVGAHRALPLVVEPEEALRVDLGTGALIAAVGVVLVAAALAGAVWAGGRRPLVAAGPGEDAALRRAAVDRFVALGTGALALLAGLTPQLLHVGRLASEAAVGHGPEAMPWAAPVGLAAGIVLACLPGLAVDRSTGRAAGDPAPAGEARAAGDERPVDA